MKAILVIDMPNWNGCKNCQFNIGGDLCTARNYEDGEDGCPLKPMTDAIPISFLKEKIDLNESWGCYGYAKGLQSAIDEWEKTNMGITSCKC